MQHKDSASTSDEDYESDYSDGGTYLTCRQGNPSHPTDWNLLEELAREGAPCGGALTLEQALEEPCLLLLALGPGSRPVAALLLLDQPPEQEKPLEDGLQRLLELHTGVDASPLTTLYIGLLLSLPGKETQVFEALIREAFCLWPDLEVLISLLCNKTYTLVQLSYNHR